MKRDILEASFFEFKTLAVLELGMLLSCVESDDVFRCFSSGSAWRHSKENDIQQMSFSDCWSDLNMKEFNLVKFYTCVSLRQEMKNGNLNYFLLVSFIHKLQCWLHKESC